MDREMIKWMANGFFGLLAASLMWSCQASEDDLSPQVEIAPSFVVDFLETLDTISPNLMSKITSVNEFDCLNYGLLFNWTGEGNSLRLSLDDFLEPDTCLPGIAPAFEEINWGFLEEGSYDLEINLKETVVNEGLLIVSEDRYNFFFSSLDGIILKRLYYNRIPDGTFWGYVEFAETAADSIAQNFLANAEMLNSNYNFLPGYYGYFNIDPQTRELDVSGTNALPLYRNFLLKLEDGEIQLFKDLLNDYRNLYGNTIQIKVFTYWGGEL